MGTRADFYANDNGTPRWLGSIAYDGYPKSGNPDVYKLHDASSQEDWIARVGVMLNKEDHATRPEQGWPWPWSDSWTSDYAYTWVEGVGMVWTQNKYKGETEEKYWVSAPQDEDGTEHRVPDPFELPNMDHIKNVTLGGRSGLLIVGA